MTAGILPPPPEKSDSAGQLNDPGFPIVGIGASAGGLAALEGFFQNLPDETGIAFVIIQHLDPNHKSMMGELLRKYTAMPTVRIQDGMAAAVDTIYLNPPDKNVSIFHGVFHLTEPTRAHGHNLPIDCFLRALAEDQGRRAICVILSGTGSDGTLGLKAIKGAGGMTMVQAHQQAEYNGMPRSAIDTGQADLVLPVEQMPAALQKYVQHPYLERPSTPESAPEELTTVLPKIFNLLRANLGHDFSGYRETTIRRRIERRMAVHRLDTLADYLRYLQQTPAEMRHLFKDLLIGVTNFFRDPEAFEVLSEQALPQLARQGGPDEPLRVWVTGCATGEEAYSLAIVLTETLERLRLQREIQVFASDLNPEAIEFARHAVYPESIAADVSAERLRRFFTHNEGAYKLKKQIRERVVFAAQNLLKDPPFSNLDLLSCRNLLIYLKPDLQKRLLPLFHYTLKPGGLLFLGASETIGEFTDLFAPLDQKAKIFQRRRAESKKPPEHPASSFFEGRSIMPPLSPKDKPSQQVNLRGLIEKIVLEDYALPCVMLNDQYQVLYFLGRTDKFLEPPAGEPVFDVLAMARQGLKQPLRSALHKAGQHKKPIHCEGVRVKQNGPFRTVDVTVRPLLDRAFPSGALLVVFAERNLPDELPPSARQPAAKTESDPHQYIQSLELDLQSAKESLQTTVEELETSNEELRSTNEELQSVNEELQSSNEELKTSKEELQSTNEELKTVNAELQHKVEELSQANNDINNLLASTDIATIFLDIELRIKRFTPAMTRLFNLINSDLGRPISDITSNFLDYATLAEDARAVLDTLERKELEIQSRAGSWYAMRIAPYRTLENIIDGVTVTFVDITTLRQARQAEQDARVYAESIVAAVRQPLLILDADLNIRSANRAFYHAFQVMPADTEDRRIYDLGDGQWDIPALRRLLEEIIPHNSSFDDYQVELAFPQIGRRAARLNARRIEQTGGRQTLILLAIEDVTAEPQT
jgi:two-component system, chemotaxis family, CheB/CheR fusion protein